MERQALEPRSPRGRATKATLVAAARRVFEREGFPATHIAEIAAEAGVATGSFYTYFNDKNEIFAAVMDEVQEEMLHPVLSEPPAGSGPVAMIEAANRAYLESYRRNARLMGLLEQVATIDDEFRELRRQRWIAFAKRNAGSIARLQEQGLADTGLDPYLAATALSAMVSRVAYSNYVLGEEAPLETLVETLTRLWASALRLPDEG
ncbi:MAG: TetR/AcrR family transcriptional regulator [Solirubrobacterales bacterium]|nr:TetR/AcrR family transcriptional regulator [Solirubrobacterales bacterium]